MQLSNFSFKCRRPKNAKLRKKTVGDRLYKEIARNHLDNTCSWDSHRKNTELTNLQPLIKSSTLRVRPGNISNYFKRMHKRRQGTRTRGPSPPWWGWTPPFPGPQLHCLHQAAEHSVACAPGSPSAQRLTDSAHHHKGLDGLGASFPACSVTFWSSLFPAKEKEIGKKLASSHLLENLVLPSQLLTIQGYYHWGLFYSYFTDL